MSGPFTSETYQSGDGNLNEPITVGRLGQPVKIGGGTEWSSNATYTSLQSLPDASSFGIGSVQIGNITYISNGVFWEPSVNYDIAIIICGQSNADGYGVLDANTEHSHSSVLMLDKGENFRVATEPLGVISEGWIDNYPPTGNPGAPKHGCGLALARNLLYNSGIKPLLVPCAMGSTSIAQWMPAADDKDLTTLFGAMNIRVAKTRKSTTPPVFVWVGHESSSALTTESLTAGIQGTEYIDAWIALMKEVRARYSDAIFLYAQLSAYTSSAGTATAHRITSEQQRKMEYAYGSLAIHAASNPEATIIGNNPLAYTFTGNTAPNSVTPSIDSVHSISTDGALIGFVLNNGSSLQIGHTYRLNITVSGTGLFTVYENITAKYSNQAVGVHSFDLLMTGASITVFNKSGAPSDLVFTNISVTHLPPIAQLNHYMIVTHDLPRNAGTDNAHLSQAGQKKLGERAALAYRQFVLGEAVNGKGPRLLTTSPITKLTTTVTVKFDSTIVAPLAGEEHWSPTGAASNSNFRVYFDGVEKTITNVALKAGDATMIEITVPSVTGVVVVTYGDRVGAEAAYRKGVIYDADGMPAPMFGPIIAV